MCQHGWGKFQREDAAAALSYLNLAEDQRLDRERQICWKKKKVGNWRCGPALVLLFQAPHSPARNCAPYQIPTNCWVSQKHHHQQRASALATDMWLEDKLVVKTTKARKRKESRFKSCAHAAFARSSFNQFTIIHKLVATTLHTLGVRLENSFFLLEHLPWILSFFSVSGLSPYSHWDVTQCIKNGNPCPPISAHFGTWKFSFLLKLLPWIFSFFLLISCSHWDVTQCMKNANPSLPSSRHFQGLEILLSSQASSMDSFFFSVFLLISCSHQDVIQCMKNVNPSLSSSWASSIRT